MRAEIGKALLAWAAKLNEGRQRGQRGELGILARMAGVAVPTLLPREVARCRVRETPRWWLLLFVEPGGGPAGRAEERIVAHVERATGRVYRADVDGRRFGRSVGNVLEPEELPNVTAGGIVR